MAAAQLQPIPACRQRRCRILMTSFAIIMDGRAADGANGAGAEMRDGCPVSYEMLGVALFGLFLSLSFRCASSTLRRAAEHVCYLRSAG